MPETPINHRSLFENACEGIYQTTPDGRFLAANPAMARILGFDSPAELIRDRTDIARQGYVRPEQREEFKQLMESFGEVTDFECEVRRKDGSTVWVSETAWAIRDANGRILFYEGFFEDISRRKASERMQAGQTQILEMIAAGAALDKVFEKLVALVETQVNGVLASVQLNDDDGKRLRHGAAPSLPQAYNKLVDGLEIGPENGSCGTAAWRKETVIVADVMTDPLWAKYRDIAKRFRIGACWSRPILSHEDELLGTFAMYYRNIRQPEINELRLIEVATQIARIAITRKKAEQALKLEQERFRFVTQATHDAIYDWDIINGLVWRNETYLILYGADDPSRKWWYDHVHPDDLPRVERSFETAFERRSHFWVDEYRLRMADGAYATVMDRGYIIYNADGEPVRKIGALTDITERKQTEAALRESQALYHSTVENMPAGVFRKDYDGRYVFVNSVFCKLKGMTVEEILGKTPRELAAYEAERDRRA
ncbi:MAG TPA: PAS domain S-box protein, partial [Desulfuromonadaceae bacterium]|nr:PAS domain S-box protein [Desulfuromonadaceae bacterium]